MSELKAYIAPTPDGTGLADYYLKFEADKAIAYHKFKRCLAMAKWCESERCKYPDAYGLISYKGLWLEKWHNRWLELAEKFKDAK